MPFEQFAKKTRVLISSLSIVEILLEKLLDDSKRTCGGRACSLFIARRFGLLGSDEYEEAKIDEILDASHDFSYPLIFIALYAIQLASKKEEKEKVGRNVVQVESPKYMNLFDKLVEDNPSGFMVGNQLTLADLHVFNIVCTPDGKPAHHTLQTVDPDWSDWFGKCHKYRRFRPTSVF